MSIGNSGRVVIEIDPDLKKELNAILIRDGSTLKDWFVKLSETCLTESNQWPSGFDVSKKESIHEAT